MEVTALEWGSLSLRDRVTVSGRDLIILMFTWPSPPCDIQYAAFVVHNLFFRPVWMARNAQIPAQDQMDRKWGTTPQDPRKSSAVVDGVYVNGRDVTFPMWLLVLWRLRWRQKRVDARESFTTSCHQSRQVCRWTSVKFAYAAPNSGGLQHLAFKSAITMLSQQSIIFSIIKRAVIYIRIVQNKGGELGLCWDCLGVSTLVGWKIIWSIHHNLLEHGKTSLMNCYKIWRRYSWLPDDEPYTLCWTPFFSSNRVFEMFGFKLTVSTAGGQIAIKPGSHIHALFWMNCNIFSIPLTDRVIDGVVMVKGQIFNASIHRFMSKYWKNQWLSHQQHSGNVGRLTSKTKTV